MKKVQQKKTTSTRTKAATKSTAAEPVLVEATRGPLNEAEDCLRQAIFELDHMMGRLVSNVDDECAVFDDEDLTPIREHASLVRGNMLAAVSVLKSQEAAVTS